MSNLGTLVVNLKANTDQFTKGLKKSESSLGKFAKSVGAFSAKLGAAGLAAGVGIVATQMKRLDEIAKQSARTGFDPESIVALGFAAEQSGSSVAQMNTALLAFTKRMGDASNGTGEAIKGLEMLGLEYQDLANLTPEERLEQVADAMAALPDITQQSAAAMSLFSDAGKALVPVFAEGSAGLEKFNEQAKAFSFSRAELAEIEKANDLINELWNQLRGVGAAATVAIAPSIAALIKGAQEMADAVAPSIVEIIDLFEDVVDWIKKADEAYVKFLNRFKKTATGAFGSGGPVFDGGGEMAPGQQRFNKVTIPDLKPLIDDKKEEKKSNDLLQKIIDQQVTTPGLTIKLQGGV